MSAETHPGLSRRQLLRRGGAVAGALALGGAGFGAGRLEGAGPDPAEETVPFRGPHQAGVVTLPQRNLRFAAFDLETERVPDLRGLLRDWTAAAAGMTAGRWAEATGDPLAPPVDTGEAAGIGAARLTLTFGFGPGLFRVAALRDQRPPALVDLPHFAGDELDPARSGGDLCVQACSDDPQVCFHAVRNLARIGRGVVTARWAQDGFLGMPAGGGTPRNLMGFKDGTGNLDASDAARMERSVWAAPGDGPAWMAGGSYLVARRVVIHVEPWDRTSLADQEAVFGRRRASGAPLGKARERDPVDVRGLDPTAHVRLANPRAAGSEDERLLRRGYNFADGVGATLGELEAGLMFLAYQRDPRRQFVPVQSRLARSDALNEYIRHTGSAIFAVPPGVAGDGDHIGSALFA